MSLFGLFGPSRSGGTTQPASTQQNTTPSGEAASTQTSGTATSGTHETSGTTATSGTSQTPASAAAAPAPAKAPRASEPPTPIDAPAVRKDFSAQAVVDAAHGEGQARRTALAAQASERVATIIEELARPVSAPMIASLRPAEELRPDAAGETRGAQGSAFGDDLKTLRGQAEPSGTILDRAA